MTQTVYRYVIPVDDQPHLVPNGTVTLVTKLRDADLRGWHEAVEVWVQFDRDDLSIGPQYLQVYGTGHPLPEGAVSVGSCLDGPFVWHVMSLPKQVTA